MVRHLFGGSDDRVPVDPVQAMEAQCNPILWRERDEVFDHGDGTMTMHFIYEPKCLTGKVPCRIASRMVAVWVDCKAQTATCM